MNAWDPWLSLLLVLSAVGLLARARSSLRRPVEPRIEEEGGSPILPKRVMALGYAAVTPALPALERLGWRADQLTWTGLALGFLGGCTLAGGSWGLAAWMFALSGVADLLDGALARKLGEQSVRGSLLDSLMDRYVELFLFVGLLVRADGSFWHATAILLAVFGSLLVTYSTAKGEIVGSKPPRALMKRAERIVVLQSGLVLAPFVRFVGIEEASWILVMVVPIAVLANLSAIVRFAALCRAVRKAEENLPD